MRNFILLLLIIPFLTSCLNKENTELIDIVNTGSELTTDIGLVVLTGTGNENNNDNLNNIEVLEEFFLGEVLENFQLGVDFQLSGDLLLFDNMFKNNKNFFINVDDNELLYFNIWRDNLFGENNTKGNLDNLVDCINGDISIDKLDGFYALVCKGENKYNLIEDSNFFYIKDTIVKYKEIYNGEDVSCEYFLDGKYDFTEDKRHYRELNDYLICNKLKNPKTDSLKDNYFYYMRAHAMNDCSLLGDNILQKLCNEELKIDPPKN